MSKGNAKQTETLRILPSDDVRYIMWRFAERYDLQMLVQSVRSVARGQVARIVSEGERNTHEWTEKKASLLKAFDESGITALFMDPKHGGYIEGPKNLALAITAFELSWVDAGAATCSLAGNLALEPIHERGTVEQQDTYMGGAVPGNQEKQLRGAFVLTEPLPFVGVETGLLSGRVRVLDWEEGKEPVLQVDKRGRFITNMDFANFACVAVESNDDKIKGSCMIILNDTDEGQFDQGAPTLKLVHQLSSTRDPVFSMKVPANRIIGGYTIKDGVIIPNYSHGGIIDAVFKRTRVTVGLMSSAKLLSTIEPVIRYQRSRFRGGDIEPNSPRYQLGIQQKEDALHRLSYVWAMGEASASLGFEAARVFDDYDPIEKEKERIMKEKGIQGGRAELKALMQPQKDALELINLEMAAEKNDRYETLSKDPLVKFVVLDSVANVLCPACKLWNTGWGATAMREAVSLMGGYGVTEDCPGFLPQKWFDTQLEATYEGPEVVQRRQLTITMTNKVFLAQLKKWISELKNISVNKAGIGANTLATAMELWLYLIEKVQKQKDDNGAKIYSSSRQAATFPLADALCWLLASRYFIRDIIELEEKGPQNAAVAEGLEGTVNFFTDLSAVQSARAAMEVSKICTELFYGFSVSKHDGEEEFKELRIKIDHNLAGVHLIKDRAAKALASVMIPEALDYPM